MPTRPLNYRLRQQAVLFSDDTADIQWQGDTWPAADPDQQVPIYVVLSLNELVKLASSVDVGSDIAYEDAVGLQYLFNRVFRVNEFCDAVAACIDSNAAVQQAINNTTNANTNLINRTTNYSSQTLIAGNADSGGCSNDAKFGRIVALIDYIDTVQQDFFEAFDSASNVLGQLDELISAIPLVETLPIDEAIGAIGNTGELWQDSYEGSVNTQLKESFACNIWCTYGDDCDLTVADVLALILERYNLTTTEGQLNVLSLGALILRIGVTVASAGGVAYVGDEFVYLSWMLQLAAIELTGTFFGVDPIDYVQAASNGSPNTGWSLCVCGSWVSELENCQYFDDWTPTVVKNQTCSNGVYRAEDMGWQLAFTATNVTRVDTTTWQEAPVQFRAKYTVRLSLNGSIVKEVEREDGEEVAGETDTAIIVNATCDEILVFIRANDTPTSNRCEIRAIKVQGTGTKPAGFY